MADITCCNDTECPLKDKCYGWTANKNEYYQSYFIESPREWDNCEYFYPLKD